MSLRPRRVAQNQICYFYRYIDIADKDHRDNLVSAALVSDRGELVTTLALVITSSGQILNIFSFTALPCSLSLSFSFSLASLFAFWRHFDLCCALSALCVHCVMLHIFTIMIVKMLRFMLIIIMAGTCHMPSRLRGLASFMACWFLFDTHKYGDQMALAMRRSLRSEQNVDTVWGLATGRSLRGEIMRDSESCEDQFG